MPDLLQDSRIIRTTELAARLGVNRATLWRWQKSGHFPNPIVLGQGATRPVCGWRENDVAAWIANRPTLER